MCNTADHGPVTRGAATVCVICGEGYPCEVMSGRARIKELERENRMLRKALRGYEERNRARVRKQADRSRQDFEEHFAALGEKEAKDGKT